MQRFLLHMKALRRRCLKILSPTYPTIGWLTMLPPRPRAGVMWIFSRAGLRLPLCLSRRCGVQERLPYEYAVLRVVPRVERAEFVNAGVIVFSRQHKVLTARISLDEGRLRSLWPAADVEAIRKHLEAV